MIKKYSHGREQKTPKELASERLHNAEAMKPPLTAIDKRHQISLICLLPERDHS